MALWARQFGIEIKSMEPNTAKQAEELLGYDFGRKPRSDVFWYYIARQQRQIAGSIPQTVSPHAYVRAGLETTVKRYEEELGWQGFEFSFDHFEHIHDRLYPGHTLDLLDTQFFVDETVNGMHDPRSQIQIQ